MSNTASFDSLGQAILSQPTWLLAWVGVLVLTHLLALAFVPYRAHGGWRIRVEALAIFASFLVAAAIMEWLFAQFGYVRLLGLAHLLGWGPVYLWILLRRQQFDVTTLFGKYIRAYLLIAGLSLVVDTIDVIRYAL
ncbi:MAG: hypothetical protein R3296_00300 [Oleiphilaceae bacterium]|nr:hypothetical protein [Oleiphilaceae bacterium]